MKKLILILSIPLLLSGCATTGSWFEANLPYVQTEATIATGTYLALGIKNPVTRTKRANQIWAASKAAYSLADGRIPTVKEFQDTFIAFGGKAPDAGYLAFVSGLSSSYKSLRDRLVASGNAQLAVQVFMDIAKGCELAAEAYASPVAFYESPVLGDRFLAVQNQHAYNPKRTNL